MSNDDVYSLQLLILRWDSAHLVGDFIASHWNVLSFNVRNVYKDVWPSIRRSNEAMAFGATEAFTDSFVDRAFRGPHSR